jgi:hypothetical protein
MQIVRQSGLLAVTIVLAATAIATAHVTPVKWSPKAGPVPHALTTTSPALATVTFPGAKTADTLLFWAGPSVIGQGNRISYARAISLSDNKWSPPAMAGKAITASAPAAAPYLSDVFSKFTASDVIVTWRAGTEIQYEIGTAEQDGTISWGPVFSIPGARASDSPAVYSPLYSRAVLVTWKAAGSSAVDYVVGSPGKGNGPVQWGPVAALPRAAASTSPSVAEVSTGSSTGRLYILWRVAGSSGRIDYATTADPLSAKISWTAPVALPPGSTTSAAPAAQAIGPFGAYPPPAGRYPLLIVYRAPHSSRLLYVTLPKKGPVSAQRTVPSLSSQDSPALFNSVLAATDPGQLFYTRPCGGC